MNFTVDDSDPTISYSDNGWAVQSQDDPDLDQFFQRTYHVATQDQATMVFQFQGNAFTLYGSRGPGHATFDVQYDGAATGGLTASAPTTAFRQVLFAHSFPDNGTIVQHLVKVTAHLVGQNRWLDLDYITFTKANGSTSSVATATIVPPWLTRYASRPSLAPSLHFSSDHAPPPPLARPLFFSASSLAWSWSARFSDGDSPAGTSVNRGDMGTARCGTRAHTAPHKRSSSVVGPSGFSIPSSSTSSSLSKPPSSKTPTVLAALFGAVLGLGLLALLAWLVLRRVCARHRARERAFRYGQSSVNPAIATTTITTASVKGGGGAYPPSASASASSPSARSPGDVSALMMRERATTPYSHTHSHTQSQRDGSFSVASNVVELQSMDERERVSERERERVGTPATSRGLVSQSPIAWTASLRKMGGGGHRGDADSLRTDFLQV